MKFTPLISLAAVLMVGATISATAADTHNIIPKPQKIVCSDGAITLNAKSTISFDASNGELKSIANYLNSKFSPASGYPLKTVNNGGTISLAINPSASIPNEGYTLNISKKGATIVGTTPSGVFYGVQTLLQLLPAQVRSSKKVENLALTLPYCTVEDSPVFQWRGLMLDVSRHWFDKQEVMRYIDQLAEYKMNVFHWHLTDDQGWRLEIKSHPELTEKGCLRVPRVGQWWQREPQQPGETPTYGGYYTQDDVREVLAYAAARFVRVIPEIDVPGHSLATLVAYPELACLNAPTAVNVGNKFYGTDENSLCVGNPASLELMKDVLKEVSELFPDEYVHIGGDECFKGFWAKCPKCQALMKSKNLSDVNQLQSWFIRQMESLLKADGKKIIGWDEISEGGLAPQATVMSWRGMQGGIDAAKAGHHVIMTPNNHCYIDLYQGDPVVEPDTYSMCRLRDSYAFEPIPDGVPADMILGGQGNLWAESVPTFRHAEYMTWPRGWALAEVLWSGTKAKDWNDFTRRVEHHFQRADMAQINYARSMYDAIITPFQDSSSNVYLEIVSEIDGLEIYYTFDNTNPDNYSSRYSAPLTIPKDATWLKVITYRDGKPIGVPITHTTKYLREASKGQKRAVGNLNLD